MGRSGLEFFALASDLSRSSQAASELLMMGLMADISRHRGDADQLRQRLISESQRYSKVFGATAWLAEARSAIEAIGAG
jgi:hypothetical protein